MRSLVVAVALLALTVPAYAASKAMIDKFVELHDRCGGYDGDDNKALIKTCAAAAKLEKQLKAQGYCIVGHTAAHEDRRLEKRCIVVR